jgi:hypothetical protein
MKAAARAGSGGGASVQKASGGPSQLSPGTA